MSDLQTQLDLNPDATFLVATEGKFTYGEVETLVGRRAGALGDRTGEQVVVQPRIDVASVVELLAVTRAGATAVIISPDLVDDRAQAQIRTASLEARPCHSILFTSGSSGAAKGVRLTRSNWDAAAAASINRLSHGPSDRWLCPLPLHHVGGLAIVYRSMAAGGSVVLAPDAGDVARWMGVVSLASLVPTQLHRLLLSRTDAFTNEPVVLVGGARTRPELLDQAVAAGIVALPTYGMTETTSQVATARRGDQRHRLFALDRVGIRIGSYDRIEVRGPVVSPGYVGAPDRSEDDWFPTSDQGRIEEDGSLVVLGRLDRSIVSGGENIDPSRVESAIRNHPGVIDAAVVGLPDDEWGQKLAAVYVGSATSDELQELVRESLQAHERPKRWLRVDAIPRTVLGKIDHSQVLAMFDL